MNKVQNKTRKKHPNPQLSSTTQCDSSQQQQKNFTPQMRIFQAKRILMGQQLPTKFKFRQKEIAKIEDTIKLLLNPKHVTESKIIMVTGSPGSGKTLSVNHILHKLKKCDYKVISLNSNMIKTKKEVQKLLVTQLLGNDHVEQKNINTFKITNLLQQYQIQKCILYIEQVQQFFNSQVGDLTEDFFDIFINKNLKIVLLGISNIIDSLQKYSKKLKINIDSVTTIVFHPYTIQQIKQIIRDKINEVKKITGIYIQFPQGLIKFVANKINEFKKGDMRMTFQFFQNLAKNIFGSRKGMEIHDEVQINIETVNKSLPIPNFQKFNLIYTLPFYQQAVLIAIYSYLLQSGQISISQQKLKQKLKQIDTKLGVQIKTSMQEEISNLSDYNLIQIKQKNENRGIKYARYLLKIEMNQIKLCFQDHPVLGKLI